MNKSDKERISKWEELGWDSKEEYDKHLLQSGEIAENDTPQMTKERILSNFKIQFQNPISTKKFTPIRKIENALFIIGGK